LNIRKNAKKYASHGIVLKATTQRIHFDALSECTPAVEFSLVRLRYRHGVSIDEILIDPILGMEFERTTAEFLPNISSRVMRQAALAVRKTRALHQITLSDLTNLRANRLEPWWSQFQPIAFLNLTEIPKSAGLMEVRESSRELYISRNENLRGAVNVLFERHAISIMENPFWKPDLSKIEIRYISETSMGPTELKRWELKLLCEQSPVFNWPPKKPKRAA